MRYLLGIAFFALLVFLYLFLYLKNKQTPVPKGCENIHADCEGCKIRSCSLHPDSMKREV